MPSVKKKTHKGVQKRFKVSATGKVMHKRCGSSHLNSHKSGSKIRRLRKKVIVSIGPEAQRLRRAVSAKVEVVTDPTRTAAGIPIEGAVAHRAGAAEDGTPPAAAEPHSAS